MYEFSKLTEGGFSKLSVGLDKNMDFPIAIKYIEDAKLAQREMKIIKDLQCSESQLIITMPLLGSSIDTLRYLKEENGLSVREVQAIGVLMLERIQMMHELGYVHGDIKPENILIYNTNKSFSAKASQYQIIKQRFIKKVEQPVLDQMSEMETTSIQPQQLDSTDYVKRGQQDLVLIDFGNARKYIKNENGKIIHKNKAKKSFYVCTLGYASVSQSMGNTLSRRDDLESLFYTLINLIGLRLDEISDLNRSQALIERNPLYADDEEYQNQMDLIELKLNINQKSLSSINLPESFIKFWSYLNKLNFKDEPDYDYLIKLFSKSLIKRQFFPCPEGKEEIN
ncbi:ck1 family protein kinase [Stylonychia lemnae]|uniref:Casein kinase I n=1 Tax=Stylonychia lemnae TaxID=5949 RepID=A0A078AYT0_STYLE|nr:ck1 family protein kinase [Stylonychia lemnae]|eukprot:CDW87291.1 ck1 family protein kinase [Stylonychia lemnae]